ncbi:hypothetical protein INT45_002553 [Circinella minor]|uniref:Retrotransposon gag domain-containing protein n=1 Tax=Circinella minor TaxID=1195481 RepID=A0A8H7VGI9_9FUNG|nr:hypothetical protein INT45_002553 [Circinella minor]
MYPDNKHKNLPNFQDYRTLPDPLIDIEQEEVTTRPEPIFDPPVLRTMNNQEILQDPNTLIMQALTKLLEKENSGSTLRAHIREPDTYNGDRNLDAAKSWAISVERYLTMAKLGEHEWVDYAAILLRGEAEVWWRQQERRGDVDDWTDFKKRLLGAFSPPNALQVARNQLAVLSQTSSVAAYVTQFQAAWATVPSMTDEEALDRFQRGLQDVVRIQVMTRFPMTTDDAMRLALAYESSTQQIYNAIQVSQSFHHINPQQQ